MKMTYFVPDVLNGQNLRKVLTAFLFVLHSAASFAGFVSQPAIKYDGFDANKNPLSIAVTWLPNIIYLQSDLTTINNAVQLQQLFAKAPDPFPVVDAFFVDAINFCPDEEYQPAVGKIVGCGELPGHAIILDSKYIADSIIKNNINGALDVGHEIGHNAGLVHIAGNNTNLMNPILGSAVITEAQFLQILNSGLAQIDPVTGQNVISIQPIAVIPVPEPSTLLLSLLSLLALFKCGAVRPACREAAGR